MFVGIGQAAVVLFLEFIYRGLRIGIPDLPEVLDEIVALDVVGEFFESASLLAGDDVGNDLIQPFPISLIVTLRMLLCLRQRALQRILFAVLVKTALRTRGALRPQQDAACGEEKEDKNEKKLATDRGKHRELPPEIPKDLGTFALMGTFGSKKFCSPLLDYIESPTSPR